MGTPNADLARALSEHSFALVEIPSDLQELLDSLDTEAQSFFKINAATPQDVKRSKEAWRTLIRRDNGGTSLLGFNEPSPYKALFRFHRGSSAVMAWPSSSFQAKVEACERRLAGYLIEHFNAACEVLFPGTTVTYASLLSSLGQPQESTYNPNPLDLFYYYNVMDDNRQDFNCEPHVDRGLMHIVYSASPGLEVFEAPTGKWLKVGGDSGSAEPRTAVVFCNAALQAMTSAVSEPGSETAAGLAPVQVSACVHRVVLGPNPRLSISLELRLR